MGAGTMERMTALTSVLAEGSHVVNELPMHPILFGVFAFVVLSVLALVTWTFRNVAQKSPEFSRVMPPEAPLGSHDAHRVH